MIEPNKLIADLETIVSSSRECTASLLLIADTIRQSGNYRWVGLYDVDHAAGIIDNVVWSGPGAPAHPQFPITKGLTGVAVAERRTVNVGDITADPRYLTAFGTTKPRLLSRYSTAPGRRCFESWRQIQLGCEVHLLIWSDLIRSEPVKRG